MAEEKSEKKAESKKEESKKEDNRSKKEKRIDEWINAGFSKEQAAAMVDARIFKTKWYSNKWTVGAICVGVTAGAIITWNLMTGDDVEIPIPEAEM